MTAVFDTYAELVRQISALRAADAGRQAVVEDAGRAAHAELVALETRHHGQSTRLVELARVAKQPPPTFDTVPANPVADPREAMREAAAAMDAADAAAGEAGQAAGRPVLLPGWSPVGRNVAVYGAYAAAGWLVQCGLYAVSSETSFGTLAWSLCGLPAMAFFAGYVTVATVGQPRHGEKLPHHAGLGGVICFVGMPVAWLFILVAFSLLGG